VALRVVGSRRTSAHTSLPPSTRPTDELQFNRPAGSSAPASQGKSSSAPSISASDIHPNARKPPTPDFEGEENPHTGEVGGPKKEPLQWEREWTYGGRATDF
jgi:hypothetical protein